MTPFFEAVSNSKNINSIEAFIDFSEKPSFGNIAKIIVNHSDSARYTCQNAIRAIEKSKSQLIIIEGINEDGDPFRHWQSLNKIIQYFDEEQVQILFVSTFSDKDFFDYFCFEPKGFPDFSRFLQKINWWIVNKNSLDKKLCIMFPLEKNITLPGKKFCFQKPCEYFDRSKDMLNCRFRSVSCTTNEKSYFFDLDMKTFNKFSYLNVKDARTFIGYIINYFEDLKPSLEIVSPSIPVERKILPSNQCSFDPTFFDEIPTSNDNLNTLNNSNPYPTNESPQFDQNAIEQLKKEIKNSQVSHEKINELLDAVRKIPEETIQLLEKQNSELKKSNNRINELIQDVDSKNHTIQDFNKQEVELRDEIDSLKRQRNRYKEQIEKMLRYNMDFHNYVLQKKLLEKNPNSSQFCTDEISSFINQLISFNDDILELFEKINPKENDPFNAVMHSFQETDVETTSNLLITEVRKFGYKFEEIVKKADVCVKKDDKGEQN